MKTESKLLSLPEGDFYADVDVFEPKDCKDFCDTYDFWRKLSDLSQKFGARAINLPDSLSECSFCYFFGFWRTNKGVKGATHSSFDAYDHKNKKRVQLKGTSVDSDLTSFGPDSVWDDLYFLHFYKGGKWDYTYDVYLIPNNKIYNMVMNKKKGETFIDQQEQGRRPRFSIIDNIIKPLGLKPQYTCNLKTGTLTKNY